MMDLTFVLTGTTHAGNIGATARAMKNMGFERLHLVGTCSHRGDEAIARASGAHDVLENARVFETLAEAVAHTQVVIGTTARDRQLAVPVETCREVAESLRDLAAGQPADAARLQAAILFGRERSGLTNEELESCTRLLRIPCNPAFSSLNLGSAVQVVAYESALALAPGTAPVPVAFPPMKENSTRAEQNTPATSEAMQHFFVHLEQVMVASGFLDPDRPRLLMRRMRRYFERNRPNVNELNILRGVLAATQGSLATMSRPGKSVEPGQTDPDDDDSVALSARDPAGSGSFE